MRRKRRYDGKPRKTEVRHGTRCRTYIERVARRDEHHVNAVALGLSEQEMIVKPTRTDPQVTLKWVAAKQVYQFDHQNDHDD
jgi:hypothetical protein